MPLLFGSEGDTVSQRVWKWERFALAGTVKQTLNILAGGLIFAAGMDTGLPAVASALRETQTAVERLDIRMGAVGVSISIADLEAFLQTGQLSSALQPYRFLLTEEVRQALSNPANLNSSVSNSLIRDLLQSTNGDRLLNLLQR